MKALLLCLAIGLFVAGAQSGASNHPVPADPAKLVTDGMNKPTDAVEMRDQTLVGKILLQDEPNNITVCGDGDDDLSDVAYADRCFCARQVEHESYIPFTVLHYCTLGDVPAISVMLLICIMLFFFYVLANTADRYLVPALNKFSEFLSLTPNVAGVTLLAFGNGAPDVFTSFSSLTRGDGSIGVGAILGAGVFVTTIVLASVIWNGGEFKTFRRPFLRDLAFYIVTVVVLFFMFHSGSVYVAEGIVFLLWYLLFVIVVMVGRLVFTKEERKSRRERRMRSTPLLKDDSLNVDQKAAAESEREAHERLQEQMGVHPKLPKTVPSASVDEVVGKPARKASTAHEENKALLTIERQQVQDEAYRQLEEGDTPLSPQGNNEPASQQDTDITADYNRAKMEARQRALSAADDGTEQPIQAGPLQNMTVVSGALAQGTAKVKSGVVPSHPTAGLSKSSSGSNSNSNSASNSNSDGNSNSNSESKSSESSGNNASGNDSSAASTAIAVQSESDKNGNRFNVSISTATSPFDRSNPPSPTRKPGEKMVIVKLKPLERNTVSGPSSSIAVEMPEAQAHRKLHGWPRFKYIMRQVINVVVFIAEAPLTLVRTLTIPSLGEADEDDPKPVNPTLVSLSLVFAPMLLCFVMDVPAGVLVLVFIGGCAAAMFMNTKLATFPIVNGVMQMPARYEVLFLVVAFVLSCTWIYLVANELVSLLECMGLILGFSKGILGLTVLAWGNSLSDLIANSLLAKSGNPKMAAAGCFGGPCFNCLMGLGLGLTFRTIKTYPEPFQFSFSSNAPIGFIFLFMSLGFTMIAVPLAGFRFMRRHAYILIGIYVTFLILGLMTEGGAIPRIPWGNGPDS